MIIDNLTAAHTPALEIADHGAREFAGERLACLDMQIDPVGTDN